MISQVSSKDGHFSNLAGLYLKALRDYISFLLKRTSILPLLLTVWLIFGFASPWFATLQNLQTILKFLAVSGIAAVGETFVLISGGLDLSVASVIGCSAVVAAIVMAQIPNPLLGLFIAISIGVLFGLLNGLAVGIVGLTPFIFTLGMHLAARGIALTLSGGISIGDLPHLLVDTGRILIFGIPLPAFIAIFMFIGGSLTLTKTKWGRSIFLLGSDEKSARYVGINCGFTKVSVYVIAGSLSGLAGFISIMNMGVAVPGLGDKLLLPIIGAVILGGTSLFGGSGSVWGTALGVLILASLNNGLNLLGFAFYDQLIAQGALILGGTSLTVYLQRR